MSDFITIFKKRTDVGNPNRLIIRAASGSALLKDVEAVSFVNGRKNDVRIEKNEKSTLNHIFRDASRGYDGEYNILVDLPECDAKVKVVLTKKNALGSLEKKVITVGKGTIRRLRKNCECCFDIVSVGKEFTTILGWCAYKGDIEARAKAKNGPLSVEVNRYVRDDIKRMFLPGELDEKAGIEIKIAHRNANKIRLEMLCGKKVVNRTIYVSENIFSKLAGKTSALVNKIITYIDMYGFRGLADKIIYKLGKNEKAAYKRYFRKHYPLNAELEIQRKRKFDNEPLFSIVMPVYRPKEKYFKLMLDSVVAQTYGNWEICLADGGGEGFYTEKVIARYVKKYGKDKIKYIKLEKNLGISANTNEAIKAACGDYIVFGDHDDEFHPSALYEVMEKLAEHPDAQLIYTDEDKVIGGTKKHTGYHFKPDYNREYLRHTNYFCHMVTVSRELLDKVGMLNSEYDGAQDYDFVLRCTEHTDKIYHIPKVLYYWRIHSASTASAPSAKNYAFVAGKKALKAHLERCNIEAEVTDGKAPGFYDSRYKLKGEPLVSVLIPNKDHADDLKRCIYSIEEKSSYRNLEYIVIENNSVEKATEEAYEEIKGRLGDRVRIVDFGKGGFNYSAINNFGRKYAKGEYLLLLNNDTALIEKDSIYSMLSYCQMEDVGIAGAKLLYNDDTVQHAGVILGFLGVAGHAFVGLPDEFPGYFARAVLPQEVSAVTAACLLVKADIYDEVKGFNETLKVSFNDIDFCLKVRQKGYKIIYDAYSKFYHYESKSRGAENSTEKIERFDSEISCFNETWGEVLKAGDPHYNCNFALEIESYKLRNC